MTKNQRKLLVEMIDTAVAVIISSQESMTIAILDKSINKETFNDINKRQDLQVEKLVNLMTKFVG